MPTPTLKLALILLFSGVLAACSSTPTWDGYTEREIMEWKELNVDAAGAQEFRKHDLNPQMVKAWMEDGQSRERVTDIVCSDGLVPDKDSGSCPDNGARVDLKTCKPVADKGAVDLSVRWTDPHFDPEQAAVYYVRVLENPSCRWTAYDAIRLGIEPPDTARPIIQERAWSSPIWYNPWTPG